MGFLFITNIFGLAEGRARVVNGPGPGDIVPSSGAYVTLII